MSIRPVGPRIGFLFLTMATALALLNLVSPDKPRTTGIGQAETAPARNKPVRHRGILKKFHNNAFPDECRCTPSADHTPFMRRI